MLHVKRANLDLGLKERVLLQVQCACLILAHGTTRLPEIPSESMCPQWIR